jgi:mono/diheme cytochrome c family protein
MVAALLVATGALLVAERYWAHAAFRDPAAAFHQGTIGTEFVPLPALQALPAIFPELFPTAGPAGDWIERYGFVRGGPEGLPYGMTLSNYRPLNAAPSPVPFVGIGCATCHVGEVRRPDGTAVRVSGMANTSLDLLAFFEAFRHAILHRVDGQPTLTLARIREAVPQPLGSLDALVVWLWLDTARKALQAGTARHDLPRTFVSASTAHSGRDAVEILRDSRFYPVGPGRTNPFNTLVTQTLGLPNTSSDAAQPNRGFARIPPVWAQKLRKWGQFDGGINDLYARSALAALTIGATVENLAHPEIAHNIKSASDYVRELDPPKFSAIFATEPDAGSVARGREQFRMHCSKCHGMPATGGGWPLPGDGRLILYPEAIGTDPERVRIRHAFDLAERLHAMFAVEYAQRYNARHPLAVGRDAIRPLTPDDRLGYIAQPIPGAALRAPLLHNGSVPSLAALLGLEERPAQFTLGRNVFDPAIAGLRTGPRDAKTYFVFDTGQRGNSAEGHRFPAAREGRDRAALSDLLAYLKTL